MTGQVIERDKLGPLTKIGQGGQGVVYHAPNAKTKFAASMVYKEYKTHVLADIDFTALAAMPALVEESLSYTDGERLISITAWPCAIVEINGTPTGFLMPAIADQFFIPLTTAKGVSQAAAEFQHLLNAPSVLVARGIIVDDEQRYKLLREVASGLAFLDQNGVCAGDISPKNLLFCDASCRRVGVRPVGRSSGPAGSADGGRDVLFGRRVSLCVRPELHRAGDPAAAVRHRDGLVSGDWAPRLRWRRSRASGAASSPACCRRATRWATCWQRWRRCC